MITEAVKGVALRHLHETEDGELQAMLWQLLAAHDDLERRRVAALLILTPVRK